MNESDKRLWWVQTDTEVEDAVNSAERELVDEEGDENERAKLFSRKGSKVPYPWLRPSNDDY